MLKDRPSLIISIDIQKFIFKSLIIQDTHAEIYRKGLKLD
jgi:hypothetical protein